MSSYAFNPFTSNLDIVGSGASYIDGVVADSSLLPITVGTPALDSVYLAKAGSGVWLINRKPAGLYVRVANNGVAADWTYLGAFPEVNAAANWEVYGSDATKRLKFNVDGLPTATLRTVDAPAGNGQMLVEGQPIGSTTRNTGAFTTLNANNGTITASAPVLDLAQTWNNAAVAFTGLRFNVTNTASAATSAIADFQVGGTSVCQVTTVGLGLGGTTWLSFSTSFGTAANMGGVWRSGNTVAIGAPAILGTNANALQLQSTAVFGWASGVAHTTNSDLRLWRDAADTLAQRRDANPQTFRLYNTTDAGLTNFERGFLAWSGNAFRIGTEAGGTGSNRNIEFVLGGATRLTLSTSGDLTWGSTGSITLPSAASFTFSGRGGIRATAQGSFRFLGSDGSTFNLLHLGVESASYPALKRVGTALQVRLGDDSAFADFECGGSTFNSLMIIRNSSLLLLNGGSIRLQTSAGADTAEIVRDAAGIVALRSGTTAHSFRVYNTSTSSNANFERANFRWAANEFIIDAEAGGTGTSLRGIKIGSATSSLLGFYGATPVDRPATVADPTGGGTVDTEARTAINDIIDRLQELGLIA